MLASQSTHARIAHFLLCTRTTRSPRNHFLRPFLAAAFLVFLALPAKAWDQWAGEVIAYSSQYGPDSWSARQTLSYPDVTNYGDNGGAWAPANKNGTQETITLGYSEPVYAEGVTIRESLGNGFVTRVDLLDTNGVYRQIWSGTDPSQPGSVVNFRLNWSKTAYLVRGVKIYVNTDHTTGWEEIDAVQLHGQVPGDFQWASWVVNVSSEYNESPEPYSASKALGVPDVFNYGTNGNAWTTEAESMGIQTITLGFERPVNSTGVGIWETNGNGFVTKIETLDSSGVYRQVWSGTDPTPQGLPGLFLATWPQTSYPTQAVRITVDTNRDDDDWEEIDAVYLRGATLNAPVPAISGISPDRVFREGPAFTLTVNGSNFERTSIVRYKGSNRTTRLISPGKLEADLTAADIATPGTADITVYTPPPGGGTSNAATLTISPTYAQWATSVIAVSSEWGNPPGSYSSARALGVPDVFTYGDNGNAWAAGSRDEGLQTITLGFSRPVFANGAMVRETCGNGFVTRIEALDMADGYHTVWSGTDTSQPNVVADFVVNFSQTAYAVRGLRITVNTNHAVDDWEEIDAVSLRGLPVSYPTPTITQLSPNPMHRGGPVSTLVVTGTGYSPSSVVRWNGTDRATTYISPTVLTIAVPTADSASNGTSGISVFTPEPGGGLSGTSTLTIGPARYGDVDGNGTTDMVDVRTALRIAAGITKPTSLNGGDVAPAFPQGNAGYGDGRISVLDALRIVRFVNGR